MASPSQYLDFDWIQKEYPAYRILDKREDIQEGDHFAHETAQMFTNVGWTATTLKGGQQPFANTTNIYRRMLDETLCF